MSHLPCMPREGTLAPTAFDARMFYVIMTLERQLSTFMSDLLKKLMGLQGFSDTDPT